MDNKTIYALSTVSGKSGVAVIRISGDHALEAVRLMTNIKDKEIKPRYAYYTKLRDVKNAQVIDNVLMLYFKAPNSFTGEDIVEFHTHGSRAVIASVIKNLGMIV